MIDDLRRIEHDYANTISECQVINFAEMDLYAFLLTSYVSYLTMKNYVLSRYQLFKNDGLRDRVAFFQFLNPKASFI